MSESVDDYLKAIFHIAAGDGWASTSRLAERLRINPSSVTGMLRRLSEEPSPKVEYRLRTGARLTEAGRSRALEMIRVHRLLEAYLHRELDYSLDEVHAEAEKLEHGVSEKLAGRIAAKLGDPAYDPHGHPIPTKDGRIASSPERSLLDLDTGQDATVASVSDSDPEMLRYICSHGLTPGVGVSVIEKAPFEGPVHVQVAGRPEPVALGRKVAALILVQAS